MAGNVCDQADCIVDFTEVIWKYVRPVVTSNWLCIQINS